MEKSPIEKVAQSGAQKLDLMRRDLPRYVVRSILAGMYLTIVVFVFWSLAHNLHDTAYGKVVASAFFGVGLSIIVFTQSELFTSNNMYLAVSAFKGANSWRDSCELWTVCYFGNLAGALIIALLLYGAGVVETLPVDHALHLGAVHKSHQAASAIFFKGVLANWVVCLAVWVALRLKEDLAKIVAMILIVFIFLYLGFEHSIANMGTFAISLLGATSLNLGDAAFNLVFSTLGNIVGGAVFVGMAYQYLEGTRRDQEVIDVHKAPPESDPSRA